MTNSDAVAELIDALHAVAIPYMVVGSLSSNAYGIPRSTQDADFVVQLGDTALTALMAKLGGSFRLDRQMSFETITSTYRYRIELLDSAFKFELFLLSEDLHDMERFRRRVQEQALGRTVWLPTAEDVVITKLRWSKLGKRTKDTEDARNVIAVQASNLDWDYIHRWCDEHGTRELLEQVRASIPDGV